LGGRFLLVLSRLPELRFRYYFKAAQKKRASSALRAFSSQSAVVVAGRSGHAGGDKASPGHNGITSSPAPTRKELVRERQDANERFAHSPTIESSQGCRDIIITSTVQGGCAIVIDQIALVTGGAGYIGSHAAWALADAGWRLVILDNLSTGRRELIPPTALFIEGSCQDGFLVRRTIREQGVTVVLHFSGSIVVPESVANPIAYYRNNLCASVELIDACVDCHIKGFVFSSTAAVYGSPDANPIREDVPTRPLNPYGRSKSMVEDVLADAEAAYGLPHVILRYFNVAGADPAGRTGQALPKATHLIKVACEVAVGAREGMEIYGTDYDTPDGTCIRDYIHVSDLADAHVKAIDHLFRGGPSLTLNCGYGSGFSVREVLRMVEQVAGRRIPAREAPRRPGDSAQLVADPGAIKERLGWQPRYCDLKTIIATALAWEHRRSGRLKNE
jgi:UDP-glucose 4-epimerase